ncbi:organic cation transporter protein [Aplysia californica]|uniref:Organic cation transporter protein n=1 Tax=Aplysia californica TaxID=6500 RepID=A0ABM0JP88_APLCA|nr:organic cation transporter protein [Aplysia californica]XP_035825639.1 organic cation transporter protein [Aplysia californica]
MSEYESILEQIRPFGPFQVRIFVLVSLFETPLAWAMLVPIFTASNPGSYCSYMDPDKNQSLGAFSSYNSSSSVDTCSKNESVCGEVVFKSTFTSVVSEWSLICNQNYVGDLISSLQMAGVLVGAVLTGQLADFFGRKKVLFGEYSLLIVFWFSTAFAGSWQVYAALRFFVGGLVGGCLVVNFVLPLEFVTPKWRTFCGCVGFWAVGLMTLALWAYFIRDWRTLNIAMSATSVILLPLWWFISESPRWLLSRGHIVEASKIIKEAAVFNKRPVPDLSSLESYVKREKIKKATRRQYSYWHLCTSLSLGKGTAVCMFGWFVASSVYYGLNFNTRNLAGDRYLNVFISGIVEIPALLFVLYTNNKLGRRRTTFLLMLTASLTCLSVLVIDLTGNFDKLSALTITMAMISKSFIAGGWAAVQVFSAETFPTVVRNIGVGACSMSARIGGIVASQFVFLGESSKAIPFTIFGVLTLLCSLSMLLLEETVGVPLQDRIHVEEVIVTASPQSEALVTSNGCISKEKEENCTSVQETEKALVMQNGHHGVAVDMSV